MRPGLPLRERVLTPATGTAVLLASVLAYCALIVAGVGSSGFHELRDTVFYNAIAVAAALFCLMRPLVRSDARLPWTLVGLGLLAWGLGDVYYSAVLSKLHEIPYPAVADGF